MDTSSRNSLHFNSTSTGAPDLPSNKRARTELKLSSSIKQENLLDDLSDSDSDTIEPPYSPTNKNGSVPIPTPPPSANQSRADLRAQGYSNHSSPAPRNDVINSLGHMFSQSAGDVKTNLEDPLQVPFAYIGITFKGLQSELNEKSKRCIELEQKEASLKKDLDEAKKRLEEIKRTEEERCVKEINKLKRLMQEEKSESEKVYNAAKEEINQLKKWKSNLERTLSKKEKEMNQIRANQSAFVDGLLGRVKQHFPLEYLESFNDPNRSKTFSAGNAKILSKNGIVVRQSKPVKKAQSNKTKAPVEKNLNNNLASTATPSKTSISKSSVKYATTVEVHSVYDSSSNSQLAPGQLSDQRQSQQTLPVPSTSKQGFLIEDGPKQKSGLGFQNPPTQAMLSVLNGCSPLSGQKISCPDCRKLFSQAEWMFHRGACPLQSTNQKVTQ